MPTNSTTLLKRRNNKNQEKFSYRIIHLPPITRKQPSTLVQVIYFHKNLFLTKKGMKLLFFVLSVTWFHKLFYYNGSVWKYFQVQGIQRFQSWLKCYICKFVSRITESWMESWNMTQLNIPVTHLLKSWMGEIGIIGSWLQDLGLVSKIWTE